LAKGIKQMTSSNNDTRKNANPFLPDKAADLVDLLGLIPHPEGGFFLEVFRSGATPMASRGQTDYKVENAKKDLVETLGRETKRPDGNTKRNALTSIFWCPTLKSPVQPLTQNVSDHVHYYQGGLPFEYNIFNPETKELKAVILGPDILNGHVLQLPVAGGMWKFGRILASYNDGVEDERKLISADYSLIAEAVGPGFDFHDFRFIQASEVDVAVSDEAIRATLKAFVHRASSMQEIDEHYTHEEAQQARQSQRL
jgi:uncharacterized protein